MYNSDMPTRAELPSKRKLIRSTLIAAMSAAILLVTVVLPAEYGVDPTRIGKVLGLTEMGQIKQQLAAEAVNDLSENQVEVLPVNPMPSIQPIDISKGLVLEAKPMPAWGDETVLSLEPGAAAEVKLVMKKGAKAEFEWVTNQGHLNSDLHADGANKDFISYRQGRAERSDVGNFIADFDGVHGWYWRNRSDVVVTVTLRVRGDYSEVKRVL